ncbi:MAG: hypothetical protein JSV68_07595 [Anaerolineaceae bacterium]|nr:MAG: hypothetical protein JSV68_07595 [Anaerolineaceae bacterium]
MDETNEIPTTEESTNLMGKFAELPSGVQRIIIAVFLLLILAAAMFLQRLIRTEEAVEEEAGSWETAESFAGEVEERA